MLAEGGEVHVVLERDLRAQLPLHELDEPLPPPPGQSVRQRDLSPRRFEHAGAADGGQRDLAPLDPGVGGQPVRDRADLRDQRLRALNPRAFVAARDELSCDVGDGGADPVASDVDARPPIRLRG